VTIQRAHRLDHRVGALSVVGLVLAACSLVGSGIDPGPDGARYRCAGFPFDPMIVDLQPGTAERNDDPPAAALRAHLQEPGEPGLLPASGWHLVGFDANRAEFIAKSNHGYASVSLERSDQDVWAATSWGGCEPALVMPGGFPAADWELALDEAPDRTSRSITVLVSERTCASGRPPDGRIVGPWIVVEPRVIRIAFGVTPLPGVQECPGSPAARVVVDLGEPKGDRQLSDFGIWPPINESGE
jgi:hypothetical protein